MCTSEALVVHCFLLKFKAGQAKPTQCEGKIDLPIKPDYYVYVPIKNIFNSNLRVNSSQ